MADASAATVSAEVPEAAKVTEADVAKAVELKNEGNACFKGEAGRTALSACLQTEASYSSCVRPVAPAWV
jgi:hypothetical protein